MMTETYAAFIKVGCLIRFWFLYLMAYKRSWVIIFQSQPSRKKELEISNFSGCRFVASTVIHSLTNLEINILIESTNNKSQVEIKSSR